MAQTSVGGIAINNLGSLHYQAKDFARAEREYRRSYAAIVEALGPDHPDVSDFHNNLANVAGRLGQFDTARDQYLAALEIQRSHFGAEHPVVAQTLNNLGLLSGRSGELAKAREYFEESARIYEAALGPDHPDLAHALAGLGQATLESGDAGAAIEPLERALVLREAGPAEASRLANTRFVLARALWETHRDRTRARELAEQAREAFAGLGEAGQGDVQEIDAWLAARE